MPSMLAIWLHVPLSTCRSTRIEAYGCVVSGWFVQLRFMRASLARAAVSAGKKHTGDFLFQRIITAIMLLINL